MLPENSPGAVQEGQLRNGAMVARSDAAYGNRPVPFSWPGTLSLIYV
jgi:hypothetical protein